MRHPENQQISYHLKTGKENKQVHEKHFETHLKCCGKLQV